MQGPEDILNWRRVTGQITTSGQPTAEGLARIAKVGVTHVTNLGPHDNDGALPNEPAIVAELGTTYVYIPVNFGAPTQSDFDQFCAQMDDLQGKHVHVHCIYNARVSAFLNRFAQEGRSTEMDEINDIMDSIWRPGGVWAEFLSDPDNVSQPNRYAGHDYELSPAAR